MELDFMNLWESWNIVQFKIKQNKTLKKYLENMIVKIKVKQMIKKGYIDFEDMSRVVAELK